MYPYPMPHPHHYMPHPHMDYYSEYPYNPYSYGYGYPDPNDPYYCYPYDQPPLTETIPSFNDYDPNQEWAEYMEASDDFTPKKSKTKAVEPKKMRPKKNVESNISNQVFSYLTNKSKSIKAIERILKDDTQKINVFFDYMDQFVKNKKKYLSRKYLGDLCTYISNRKQYDDILKLNKLHILSLEQFRQIASFLIFHYLRSKCTVGVLTSVKLSSELRREHLERKRQILAYLEEYVQPDMRYRNN